MKGSGKRIKGNYALSDILRKQGIFALMRALGEIRSNAKERRIKRERIKEAIAFNAFLGIISGFALG